MKGCSHAFRGIADRLSDDLGRVFAEHLAISPLWNNCSSNLYSKTEKQSEAVLNDMEAIAEYLFDFNSALA